MHINMSQEPEIYRKNAADQNGAADFVRACAVETHVKISQESLYTQIYRQNAADQNRAADFVRVCAGEIQLNISQEPLYTEIYRKNAAPQSEHPDEAPASAPTAKTLQCGHSILGKNLWLSITSSNGNSF